MAFFLARSEKDPGLDAPGFAASGPVEGDSAASGESESADQREFGGSRRVARPRVSWKTRSLSGRVVTESGAPFYPGTAYAYSLGLPAGLIGAAKKRPEGRSVQLGPSGRFRFSLESDIFDAPYCWLIVIDDSGQRLLKTRLLIRDGQLVQVLSAQHPGWYLQGQLLFDTPSAVNRGMITLTSEDGRTCWGAGRFEDNGRFRIRADFVPWDRIRGAIVMELLLGDGLGYCAARLPFGCVSNLIEASASGIPITLRKMSLQGGRPDSKLGLRRLGSPGPMRHILTMKNAAAVAYLSSGRYVFSILHSSGESDLGQFTVGSRDWNLDLSKHVELRVPGKHNLLVKITGPGGAQVEGAELGLTLLGQQDSRLQSRFVRGPKSPDHGTAFKGLVSGEYRLSVRAPGWRAQSLRLSLVANRRMRVVMSPETLVNVETVSHGQFCEYGDLTLCYRKIPEGSWTSRVVHAGFIGDHLLRALNPGPYELAAKAGDWVGITQFNVPAQDKNHVQQIRVPLPMEPCSIYEGVLTRASGRPVSGLKLRLVYANRPALPWERMDLGKAAVFRLCGERGVPTEIVVEDKRGEPIARVKPSECGRIQIPD